MIYRFFLKRAFDIFWAVILLILTAPFFLLVIVLLAFNNQGGIFFMQQRIGYKGRTFRIYKFKTMNDLRDANGVLQSDEKRLTSTGRFIRNSSLDELPQLLNVINGDMSLLGPRPLLVDYLPLYSKEQLRRHDVRPGISGWAQVNGRNAITWQKKFEMDIWYVDNLSFWVDLKILFLTLQNVLQAKDINAVNQATTERFKGNF